MGVVLSLGTGGALSLFKAHHSTKLHFMGFSPSFINETSFPANGIYMFNVFFLIFRNYILPSKL